VEELEFGVRELYGDVIERNFPTSWVDHQPFATHNRLRVDCGSLTAPKYALHSRQQDPRTKGFCEIIVRPQFEPCDHICLFSSGGYHDDGNGAKRRISLQLSTYVETIHTGKHQVENHQIGGFGTNRTHRLLSRGHARDTISRLREVIFYQLSNIILVIDD
jgi:hypothetical protein